MRILVGLIVLMAGFGAVVVFRPSLEDRLGQRGAAAEIVLPSPPTSSEPRLAFTRQPLVASRDGSRAPANILSEDPKEALSWTPILDLGSNSSGMGDARRSLAVPSSHAATAVPLGGTLLNRLASSKPADADSRRALARELQRELKRVGCYEGAIDGSWGQGSKRAMSAFTDRVNATLPVEEPDYILLALVRGQPPQTCGNSCPPGQDLADHGRCLPRTIIAPIARINPDKTEQRVTASQRPLAEHGDAEAAVRGGLERAWETAAAPTDGAGKSRALAPPLPVPGRMAVGATAQHTEGIQEIGAALPEASASGRSKAAADNGPLPKPSTAPDRLQEVDQGTPDQQKKITAAPRRWTLGALKRDRAMERPRSARRFAAAAPFRGYRAPRPVYRTARRHMPRPSLASWWRQWQYALSVGIGGPWR